MHREPGVHRQSTAHCFLVQHFNPMLQCMMLAGTTAAACLPCPARGRSNHPLTSCTSCRPLTSSFVLAAPSRCRSSSSKAPACCWARSWASASAAWSPATSCACCQPRVSARRGQRGCRLARFRHALNRALDSCTHLKQCLSPATIPRPPLRRVTRASGRRIHHTRST
jgi:hypothetical protein